MTAIAVSIFWFSWYCRARTAFASLLVVGRIVTISADQVAGPDDAVGGEAAAALERADAGVGARAEVAVDAGGDALRVQQVLQRGDVGALVAPLEHVDALVVDAGGLGGRRG